jgi:hypothetical protein
MDGVSVLGSRDGGFAHEADIPHDNVSNAD